VTTRIPHKITTPDKVNTPIGNTYARVKTMFPLDPGHRMYKGTDSEWVMAFADKDTYCLKDGARRLDSRRWMHYNAVVVTKLGFSLLRFFRIVTFYYSNLISIIFIYIYCNLNNLPARRLAMKEIEGVYQVDIMGPYGWERFSTAFIRDGRYRGASAEHFTHGSYQVEAERFSMIGSLTQYIDHRPLFGEKGVKERAIKFNGTIGKGVIEGEARVETDNRYTHSFRLNKLPILN
jgi:hypothetical protein